MEMAESAPMPGSTPMRLPISTPKNDHIRLCGCSATPKPYHKPSRDSCMASAPSEQRKLHLQSPPEDDQANYNDRHGQHQGALDRVLAIAEGRDEHDRKGGGHQPSIFPQDHKSDNAERDAEPAAPFRRKRLLLGFAFRESRA